MSDTVLVTGGAGYIGSHAVKALAAAGRRVVVYDDLSAGHREAVATIGGDVRLVEGDIRDTARVCHALSECRAGAVMHFAAWLVVPDSVADPIGYYRNNVTGALSVLEAMAATGVSRFIFSSTCAVYGDPVEVPMTEAHPTRPINTYGETKLAVERALPHLERAHGVRSIALRYFNAAGADPDGVLGEDHAPEIHLIPRALAAAAGGPPLLVFGDDYDTPDGTCQRDYIHVTDLADAHCRALEALEHGTASGVINLGTGRPHSVREVVQSVARVTGRAVPCVVAPRRPGDPARLFAATTRAHAALGWRPRFTDLDAIVGTADRWHRTHPHGYAGGAA
jgi:UDP-glucose-4-epimerase GalE